MSTSFIIRYTFCSLCIISCLVSFIFFFSLVIIILFIIIVATPRLLLFIIYLLFCHFFCFFIFLIIHNFFCFSYSILLFLLYNLNLLGCLLSNNRLLELFLMFWFYDRSTSIPHHYRGLVLLFFIRSGILLRSLYKFIEL